VRGPHVSRAQGDRTCGEAGDAKVMQRGADPDDISDGVPGADLVEMDLGDGDPVGAGLRLSQAREHRTGSRPDGLGELGLLDHRAKVPPGAVREVGDHCHDVHLGGAHPGPAHACHVEAHSGGHDCVNGRLARLQPGAGVDQRGEQHVAGDPGARVDPAVSGHVPAVHRGAAICAARCPAP